MALPESLSACAMCVEIMTGTVWTDVSDNVSVITPPPVTRDNGHVWVFGEDTAALGSGRLNPAEIPIRGVFAEGTADPFYTLWNEFTTACGDMVALRWSPGGCTTAHDSFSTSTTKSEVIMMTPPGGDASSAEPLMWDAVVKTPSITRAAWA